MNRFWRKFTQPMSAVTQMWILFSPFLRTLLDVQPSLLTISCSYIYNSLLSLHVRFCFIFAYPSNIHALTSNNFLQGSHASLEHIDDKIPQFNSPLCTLKQISFEVIHRSNSKRFFFFKKKNIHLHCIYKTKTACDSE